MISLALIASDIFGALPIIRWLINNEHTISYKQLLPLVGLALIFLFHSVNSYVYLNDSIYFFFIFLVLIFSKPVITTSALKNTFPIVLFIALAYIFLINVGVIEPSDVDYFRNSEIYVLRYPFAEPGHFALIIGAIEILLYLQGYKPRIAVIIVILVSGSLTAIMTIGIIMSIAVYKNPKKYIYYFLLSMPFFTVCIFYIFNSFLVETLSKIPIILRVESVLAGGDVSILRRLIFPLEKILASEFVEKLFGNGYGTGFYIETLLYQNKNFLPNNFYFSAITQFGMVGLFCIISIYMHSIPLKKFLVIMPLLFINGYIFTSVNLFLVLLFKATIVKNYGK